MTFQKNAVRICSVLLFAGAGFASQPISFSGIYPHLAFFNNERECGTGAVVPWAGSLWAITYAPHKPQGSSDKLYQITPDLELIVRPESIGGTPANRMIHRESNQLFIGPYAIDASGGVRVIPYSKMLGRPTANARHLTDPTNKIYYATMEEGLYEVDVKTLEVTELWADNAAKSGRQSGLPGYHGKGAYSGQGRLVYANNGERSAQARENPFVPSGVLAEWDGEGDWEVVLRKQFTEVTGPGGIQGSSDPENDPIWSVGWDAKSLILMLLEAGEWHRFRLPKSSHSYDGAHGWNTEWPRIREIGEGDDYLMTMHGMFWRFPAGFRQGTTAGIRPRSSYLKVIGDFCRWGDRLVFGCDDTAASEFLNKRKAKGHVKAPQSQSNLWFVEPAQLDHLGPVLGRGAVWLEEELVAGAVSDPMLMAGFSRGAVHLVTDRPTELSLEVDRHGSGEWESFITLNVDGSFWYPFPDKPPGEWVRVRTKEAVGSATAWFTFRGDDDRPISAQPTIFKGVAQVGEKDVVGGLIRARSDNHRDLEFSARTGKGHVGHYLLDGQARLVRNGESESVPDLEQNGAIPSRKGVLDEDAASLVYTTDQGQRYRLPRNPAYSQAGPLGFGRICREVATERDLFNAHGTFYELPARNAGGFAKVRPVSSHSLAIADFCSYRGLLVLSGVDLEAAGDNPHVRISSDGKAGLWIGAVDDLWALGKPVGQGGPWKDTPVKAGVPSDPYLMTGYDEKELTLHSGQEVLVHMEVDISGMGHWVPYKSISLRPNVPHVHTLHPAFQAYWVRFRADSDATVSAQFVYR